VIFVSVDNGNDLMRRLLQRLCHGATDFEHIWKGLVLGVGCKGRIRRTCLGPWLGEGNVQRPLLPTNILVCLAEEVRLPPLLLKELDYNLSPSPWLVGAVYGAHQGKRLLLDERLQVDIVDGGKGQVEKVACQGRDGGEVAMEEDGVQDGCGKGQPCFRAMCMWRSWVAGWEGWADGWKEQLGAAGRTRSDSPFTTSLTQAASAKISRLYSGRRLGSILAWALEEEVKAGRC